MNLATKTMPWMAASFLAAASLFGQNQNQGGCPPQPSVCKPVPPPRCGPLQAPQQPTVCAYNAPAEINIGMQGDIDFFVTGSFIYWQPSQDNMSIGLTDNNPVLGVTPEPTIQGAFIDMDFDFKPGFQVGAGMNLQWDDWVGYVEYTRVHGTHHASSNGPLSTPSILATQGHSWIYQIAGQLFNTANGSYRNNLDFVDVEMSRVYYVGRWLVFHSAWGARGAWITQNMHTQYRNTTAAAVNDISATVMSYPGEANVYQRAHSWGLGPRLGLIMDWMLGCGFRFFGSGYGDILYSQYKIQDKTVFIPYVSNGTSLATGRPVSIITYDKARSLLRAHMDFEMGLGWGSYFDHNDWHIDLSASYGFQVFFDQNMFRQFPSARVGINTMPHGNLYVQGLTATLRIDF